MEYLNKPAIVIDNGSTYFKIGFEGDEMPLSRIPNMTGFVVFTGPFGTVDGSSLVGYEVINEEADYLWYSVRNGIVENWDSLEQIYNHFLYRTMGVDTSTHAFVITDSAFNFDECRQKMASFVFEKFDIPALSICDQSVMSLKFAGRRQGLVVDCGGSGCNVVPVYNGRPFTRAVQRINVGGEAVTQLLVKYLRSRKYRFETLKDMATANDIKSTLCHISDYFWKDLSRDTRGGSVGRAVRYGRTYLQLGEERYVAGEALFRPTWVDEKCRGIHQAIVTAIASSPPVMRHSLIKNVVLCGGTSLLRGFPERVTSELKHFPETTDLNVVSLPRREVAGWIGASTAATEMKYTGGFITREQYQENGPQIIRNLSL